MIRLIINGATGAMGRTITQCAQERAGEFSVVAGIAKDIPEGFAPGFPVFETQEECDLPADIVVDFSMPDAVPGVIALAKRLGAGLVIGTTGLDDEKLAMIDAAGHEIPIFMASNMSLGVNLQIDLVKRAASFLGDGFDVEITERHHNRKVDAPSGTAMSIAKALQEQYSDGKYLVYDRHSVRKRRDPREIGMHALRGGTIVGEHSVMFAGEDEILEISHSARSKKVFAMGALRAAKFIFGRAPKVYSMGEIFADLNSLTDVKSVTGQSIITITGLAADPAAAARIFGALAEADINIDMISQTAPVEGRVELSFTLPDESLAAAKRLLEPEGLNIAAQSGLVKFTVEGFGMEHRPGVAARMFGVMAEGGVSIRLITTSETKISYCIEQKDVEAATRLAKEAFGL